MAKIYITTPFGVAKYPKLDKKDTYQGKETNYNCSLLLDAESFAKFKEEFDAKIADERFSVKKPKLPFKRGEDEEEGLFSLKASSNYKPSVFDSKKQELPADTKVGGGSEVRLSCEVSIYKDRSGISLRLNAVQVRKLVEYTGGSASAFDEVEDGFVADTTTAADSFDDDGAAGDSALDI